MVFDFETMKGSSSSLLQFSDLEQSSLKFYFSGNILFWKDVIKQVSTDLWKISKKEA